MCTTYKKSGFTVLYKSAYTAQYFTVSLTSDIVKNILKFRKFLRFILIDFKTCILQAATQH